VAERWAPGDLRFVQEFLNTVDLETARDELSSPVDLEAWLRQREELLPPEIAPVAIDEGGLRRALEVREAIRALAMANHGDDVDPAAVATLNSAAEWARLAVSFTEDGIVHMHPQGQGADALIARIFQIVYQARTDGTWPRFKVCRKDSCRWAFYDHSKNHSSAWCSMRVCGNRAKAQAYRDRHKLGRG
jgi:predicted RNA-binding Zn ribbon-like protein